MSEEKSGGFHIGDVGGDVKIEAGGDIVGRDKVTTTHAGFNDEGEKQEFLNQLDELRSALGDFRTNRVSGAARTLELDDGDVEALRRLGYINPNVANKPALRRLVGGSCFDLPSASPRLFSMAVPPAPYP